MITRKKVRGLWLAAAVITAGFLLPESPLIPVQRATPGDWNANSFWYHPRGPSVVHKGIDIFAGAGQPVVGATGGVVVYKGTLGAGGNVVVLGPKWRCHYYAHLSRFRASWFSWVSQGEPVGQVGTTGNAQGKPPHLHYSVFTLLPYFTRWDNSRQGWMKMFFLDPNNLLRRR
jgi:murein DD-endopeptidase MepM/ murein hydrolase activator NlpD